MVQKPKSSMKLLPLLTNNYLDIPQPMQVTFDHQQTQQNQNVSPLTTLLQQMSHTASPLNQQSDTRQINSMQSQTALFLPFQKQRTFNQPISNLTPYQIKINPEANSIVLTAEEKKKEIIRRRRMKFDEAKPQLSIGDVVDLIIARKDQICRSGGNDEGSQLESLRAKDYILLKLGKNSSLTNKAKKSRKRRERIKKHNKEKKKKHIRRNDKKNRKKKKQRKFNQGELSQSPGKPKGKSQSPKRKSQNSHTIEFKKNKKSENESKIEKQDDDDEIIESDYSDYQRQ
ncbi:MAG: hypothetical protein EZS28_038582, partial [Streblomastix strix]